MTQPSTTRRGLLSAAGATLLAGCSSLDSKADDPRSIRALQLREVVSESTGEPVVAERLPVEIERSKLAASAQRVDELLADIPIPFGPESVPNGYVRQRLTEAAREATDHVGDARTAASRLVALNTLQWARSRARYAAAGWAFVDRGLTVAELRTDHREILNEADSFRADVEYLASDPVTAALVYGQAERLLESVDDEPTPGHRESSQLLTVAEWGDHVESARVHLDDARYLHDRFQSTLPTGATSVSERLSTATETLRVELQNRQEALPPESTDANRLRWRLQNDLRDDAESSVERVTTAPGPASSLLESTRGLTALLATEKLAARITDGETFGVETAAAVQQRRTTAIAAIRSALAESPRADLARPMLAEAANSVSLADDRLTRLNGEVRLAELDDPIALYTAAAIRARSVPAACRATLDALDN